jgi:hypothetical protein
MLRRIHVGENVVSQKKLDAIAASETPESIIGRTLNSMRNADKSTMLSIEESVAALTERKKIYLSGPMTGIENFNFPLFHHVAKLFRALGTEVVNPAENGFTEEKSWAHYMRADIKQLVDCNVICLLPGWERSRGSTLELFIATQLGMEVMHYEVAK